jgi:hypothetical protein
MVLLPLHDLLATGRSVLGVSFVTSQKSNLRTAVTTENTVHTQNAIALQTRVLLTGIHWLLVTSKGRSVLPSANQC